MWNRKYFLDIYSSFNGHNYLEGLFYTVPRSSLYSCIQSEEISANIIIILAKFADEILKDIQSGKGACAEEIDEEINQFLEYLKDKDVNLNNVCRWVGRHSARELTIAGNAIYSRYSSTFGNHAPSRWNSSTVILSIKRSELKRIIYQFLLDEEIDFQGFYLYLDYVKSSSRLIYRANPTYKPYVKSLLDKDITLRHMVSRDNINFIMPLNELERIAGDLNVLLI